jgi:serine O-acetyltransferase
MASNMLKKLRNFLLTNALVKIAQGSGCLDLLIKDSRNWIGGEGVNEQNYRTFFLQKFIDFPEFRSLFYYRVGRDSIFLQIMKILYPPQSALFICTSNIGPGLYLEHAFSTIISAKLIGANCQINQQVTIGFSPTGSPTIGNDVKIFAGAILFGGITIGDNVIIGAGALVNKSVAPNCTVAGNPARVIGSRAPGRTQESITSARAAVEEERGRPGDR